MSSEIVFSRQYAIFLLKIILVCGPAIWLTISGAFFIQRDLQIGQTVFTVAVIPFSLFVIYQLCRSYLGPDIEWIHEMRSKVKA